MPVSIPVLVYWVNFLTNPQLPDNVVAEDLQKGEIRLHPKELGLQRQVLTVCINEHITVIVSIGTYIEKEELSVTHHNNC